jgi:hypothetical protein
VTRYSDKEQEMFKRFELGYLLEHLEPPALYRTAVEHVFVNEMTGVVVDSLRRCFKALCYGGYPYRMTPEFDALITLT